MVVVVADSEVPGQRGDAGVAVHLAPRAGEMLVRGRGHLSLVDMRSRDQGDTSHWSLVGHPVVVDVVPGGHDEVARVQLAPLAHGL